LTETDGWTKRQRDIISQRMKADLIIANIGQLVTCAAPNGPKRGTEMRDAGIIANGAVVISDGKFVDVGISDQITSEYLASEVLDAESHVVSPGFVDPHTHIVYAGNRLDEFELKIEGADYLKILENGGGILSTVKATREAGFDDLVTLGLTRLDKMLACGTTTCEIKTGYGLNTESELKMLQVIDELDKSHPVDVVPTLLGAHAIPPEFRENTDAYVDLVCEKLLPEAWAWFGQSHFASKETPFFCDVFMEKNAFDISQSQRILETAKSFGFRIKAHVDQFTNLGGTQLAIDLNAASVDHLDAISDKEIDRLASSNTVGVVIPTENFNAGKTQFAPARRMIDSGCAIAISTDYNPGSAPCPSQPMAMAIACRYHKLLPSEAMNAATINAAHSIGLGAVIGSIEAGKNADLLLMDANDFRELPFEFGLSKVAAVFKNGIRVFSRE
jgi:imidazolonepropionase